MLDLEPVTPAHFHMPFKLPPTTLDFLLLKVKNVIQMLDSIDSSLQIGEVLFQPLIMRNTKSSCYNPVTVQEIGEQLMMRKYQVNRHVS